MSGPVAAILLTVVVHVIGAIVLVWAMAGSEALALFRTGGSSGDDGGQRREPAPVDPPAGPSDGVPLPDAELAAVRLREAGRIGERYPRRPRRPEHVPAPDRERERV